MWSRSGAALFISAEPAEVTPEERKLLKTALTAAARVQPEAEPLDWMETTSPPRIGGWEERLHASVGSGRKAWISSPSEIE